MSSDRPAGLHARRGASLASALLLSVAAFPWLFPPTPVAAQGLGSAGILGEVVDGAGQPVELARVEAHYIPTGTVASVSTGPEGRFRIRSLRPGPYRVTVSALGFGDFVQEGIVLRADQSLELSIALSGEPIRLDELSVAPGNPRFDVSRMAPALSLRRDVIESLPTIERSFLEMAALSPMAVQTREQSGYSISGQPERHNAILVDGALSQDVFGTSTSGVAGARARAKPLPMDAIQEMQVETAPFDVRSSGYTGGVLNAITRSGTNEWRGSFLTQFRDERFFGDLVVDSESMAPADYQRWLGAFTLGGPLVHDRAHVFLAAESENRREPAPGFTSGVHDPLRLRVSPDSLARISQILSDEFGLDAGTPGVASYANPLTNTFARLDVQLNDRHEFVLRHNFAHAARDSFPNRAAFGTYEFSSAGYRIESSSHALIGTLTSRVGEEHSNELVVNVYHNRERSRPASAFPQIDVRVASEIAGDRFIRDARVGSRYFSQRDELDQTVIQLKDALTLSRPDRLTILGGSLEIYRFRHDQLPGTDGYYRFDSLEDLAANRPSHYETQGVSGGEDPAVTFSVAQPSLFAQNEHTFSGGFSLDYGLRLDIPILLKRPQYAETVDEEFGRVLPTREDREVFETMGLDTDGLPTPAFLVSPRMGFNFQTQETRYRTQVRGGWGVFTGRMPFSWLSDTYRHNGLHTSMLSCAGDAAPALDPAAPAPRACTDGEDLDAAGEHRVFGFDPGFEYPRELKVSISIDQEVPGGVVASLEGIFAQTFGRPILKEMNLSLPNITDEEDYYERAFGERLRFGDAVRSGYRPVRRVDGYSQVLSMESDGNTSAAYTLTIDVEKEFGDRLRLQGSYSWAHSNDRQSLVFPNQALSFASSPVGLHPNQPSLARAAMDRPWKAVGSARLRLPPGWGGSEFSLVYTGQAGIPYSYVYGGDINGDGYSGPGIPLDASNDLLFVPDHPAAEFASPSVVSRTLFARLVAMEPCLEAATGGIMRRHACRAPDTHRLNLHVAQPFQVRGLRVAATADVLNVLNLLNHDWGLVWEVDPVVPVVNFVGRDEPAIGETVGRPQLGYGGEVVRNPETGRLEPRLPHFLMLPASQWQAQVGLRVSF